MNFEGVVTPELESAYAAAHEILNEKVQEELNGDAWRKFCDIFTNQIIDVKHMIDFYQTNDALLTRTKSDMPSMIDSFNGAANKMRPALEHFEHALPTFPLNAEEQGMVDRMLEELRGFQGRLREAVADITRQSKMRLG